FSVKLIPEPDGVKYQQNYTTGAYDAFTFGWVADFPDPENFTRALVGKDNTLHNGYSSPIIDQLIAETQRHSDRRHTIKTFSKIQKTIAQSAPVIPLWQRKDYVLTDQDTSGGQYLSDGTGIWRLWKLNRI
ncbi:ABC transporter substrate-binding protein, partial [Streptomyces chryseus]